MKWKLLIAVVAVSALAACSKSDDKAAEKPAEQAEPTPAEPAPEQPAAEQPATGLDAMFASYEECRALLANDKGEGVSECAGAIAEAAKQVGNADIAAKANELAKVAADDMPALRLAFGAVSESVVALLMESPDVAKKYHVFECPMAKGYKRWVQPTAKLENPYMGQQMLECGSEVHDHHGGKAMEGGHMEGGHMNH